MKTTLDSATPLFDEAKRFAAARGLTWDRQRELAYEEHGG